MKKILFVDDEPRILDGLRRMLRSMRHEWKMSFVDNGFDAINILDKEMFDAVVTDIRMPDMDGVELLGMVKKRHPQVVRIVLSGQSNQEKTYQPIGQMHHYLSKPCSIDDLKSTLKDAFN